MATQQLARKTIIELTPYQSARRIGGHGNIWLNANESPDSADYPQPQLRLNRYPEFQPPELIQAYADYSGVSTDQIIAGRGADEAIDLLIRTYCEPGIDRIVINPPTYGMYGICAKTWGVDILEQPVDEEFNPDYSALEKIDAKLFFICSPNNPTGSLADLDKLAKLAKSKQDKALVIVDEAYIEFSADKSAKELLSQCDNLVILRTLSKAFALAGIRCGFTLAHPDVIQMLFKTSAPYPISTPIADIATEVLTNRLGEMKQRVQTLNQIRNEFCEKLLSLEGVEHVFPATGNFVLVRFSDPELFKEMGEQEIVLRDFDDKPRLKRSIRISIGNEVEMAKTLATIQKIIEKPIKEYAS